MLSQTAEYALRAIVFLADNEGKAHTSDAISSVTKVPAGYLAKILQGLAKAGLITSQRGPYGGFSLAVDKDVLTALDVVQATAPFDRIHSCPLGLQSHGTRLCGLHRLMDSTVALVQQQLGKATIGSLLVSSNRSGSHPLCDFPRHVQPDKDKAERRSK